MVGGLDAVADFVATYLPARWLAITVPLLVLAVVTLIDPPTTLVLLATGPLLVLLLAVIGSRARALTQRRFDEMRWLGAFFLDILQGVATLKLFGRSREQVDNVERLGRRYADSSMEVLRTAFQTSLVLEWASAIAVALVAVEVSLRLMAGAIDFERALAVLVVTPVFFLPLRQLAGQYHLGSAGRAAGGPDRCDPRRRTGGVATPRSAWTDVPSWSSRPRSASTASPPAFRTGRAPPSTISISPFRRVASWRSSGRPGPASRRS